MDGTIWCWDPTDRQENPGNVGWSKVFQGKTAECSSPVWTQRPRLLEVPNKESSTSDSVCCSNVFLTSYCTPSLSISWSLFRHQNPPPCIFNSSHSSCPGDPEKHCTLVFWSSPPCCFVSFPSKTTVTTIWQRRPSSLGISLETYTFALSNRACTVHIKLPFYWTFQRTSDRIVYHQHGRFHIGSTSITAAKRDFNRMAKLETLSDSAVHVELAIRYWASHPSDFHQFSTIVLRSATLYEDAWIYEHFFISKWQAPLDFPFITGILKLKAKGWQLQYRRHNKQFPRVLLVGDRLYQRVRRKLHSLQSFVSEFSFQKTAWTILYISRSNGFWHSSQFTIW